MPDYFIDACPNCSICNSDIRVVRNRHPRPSGFADVKGDVSYPEVPFSTEADFLRNTCRMPSKNLNKTSVCASEFRYASMLSVCMGAGNTTFNTYGCCTNGSISINVCANTVNNEIGTGNKYYGFSKDNGKTFCVKNGTNTHTFSNLAVGNYRVQVRDNTVTCAGCSRSVTASACLRVKNGTSDKAIVKNVQSQSVSTGERPGYDDSARASN